MAFNVCNNCSNQFTGKFCNECGEKIFTANDKSIKHIFEEAFHFLTHFEGKFFNTLKAIIARPGKLSFDYCQGVRRKYFKPMSFFLMVVIIYLLFPFFEGLNMRLKYHEGNPVYGTYAQQKTSELKVKRNLSDERLSELFQRKSEKTSKFLLFLAIPFMAIASWGIGFSKRKYFYDHFIFSIEATAFFILWGFLILPLIIGLTQLMRIGQLFYDESHLAIVILVVYIIFLFFAAKRFFGFSWWGSLLFSIVFAVGLAAFLQTIYKFILFVIAIHLL